MPNIQIIYILNLIAISLCIGSFLNVVIYRLPIYTPTFTLNTPRSHCPICKHQLSWYENIPVLAWCILLGRCRSCKTKISVKYPFFEIVTSILMTCPVLLFGLSQTTLLASINIAGMIPIITWNVQKKKYNKQMKTWTIGTLIICILTIMSTI